MNKITIPLRNPDTKYYKVTKDVFTRFNELGYEFRSFVRPNTISEVLKHDGCFVVDSKNKIVQHRWEGSLSHVSNIRSSLHKGKFAEEIASDLINYYYTLDDRRVLSTECIKTVLHLVDRVMHEIDTNINLRHFSQYVLNKKITELWARHIGFRNQPHEREEMLRYKEKVYNPIVEMFESIGYKGLRLIADQEDIKEIA